MKRSLLTVLAAGFALLLAGCGGYAATSTVPEPPTGLSVPSTPLLADGASPEDVRLAVLAAVRAMGPARVRAEARSSDSVAQGLATVEQLVDRDNRLARETRTADGDVYQQISVVGGRRLTLNDDGEGAWVSESNALDDPATWDFPFPYLEDLELSETVSAHRLADGGWELVVRSPYLNSPLLTFDEETSIEVGPDLLPRKMTTVVDLDGEADGLPEGPVDATPPSRITLEVAYQIENIAPLDESDVELSLPPGVKVTERSWELSVERPRADVAWPQYWLGREFQGVALTGATFSVSGGAAEPEELVSLAYGDWDRPPEDGGLPPAGLVDLQQGPRPAAAHDSAFGLFTGAGPYAEEQRVVAGREAAVLSRVTKTSYPDEGPPWVEVLVQFPDVTVYLQGGVDGGTVEALLTALQQL